MVQNVTVLIGAGAIGVACARRVSANRHIVIADVNIENAKDKAELLRDAGFFATETQVDISSRKSIEALSRLAVEKGQVDRLIHAAGVSPSQAEPETILKVDLFGTAVILEAFGEIIAEGGAGIVIASQSGHRLPALTVEQDWQLAMSVPEDLLALDFVRNIDDSLHAYQVSKRGNALRVKSESVKWGKRGARINAISPGIIITPLARDELTGPRAEGYHRMIAASAVKRAGTADEVANLAELMMSDAGSFISGSDFLIDGGVTAAFFYGDLAAK